MNDPKNNPNKLLNEKSPYLLQHIYNPVNWYPWGEEAFNKAKKENKPIFLSIGYSTCHWCHVMAHESFEDSTVAELMNEVFINIKVDREERPDIDNIYMSVCQMMTGGGGWPLTIIMTSDKKPFFSGTYFPKENKYGRVGMISLIKQIDNAWKTKRDEIEKSAEQITNYLTEDSSANQNIDLGVSLLEDAFHSFKRRFDKEYGGFGNSPKFPSPHNLMFLLRYWKRTKDNSALEMVEKTLNQMRMGGLFDQIGFGFHRYSTDKEWLLPHFEKMLYDQALISMALVETYQATKNEQYKIYAEEIYNYVLRDMTSRNGGFYSAEDADSEGEEGKFYVWTEKEINELLKDDAEIFNLIFNIKHEGNFTDEATRTPTGTNIPHLKKSITEFVKELNIPLNELKEKVNRSRQLLFNEREKRIHPLKDDKILTDWNGLMIASLAKAGKVFNNEIYIKAAEKSLEFIFNNLSNEEGILLHRYRDGESSHSAHADDYAFIINGLLELYEATFDVKFLIKAINLNSIFVDKFYDNINGGFFFTSEDNEKLIARTKEIYDGAVPSANSVEYLNLIKLGRITADNQYEDLASKLRSAFSEEVAKNPTAYSQFLIALDFELGTSYEVILAEGKDKNRTRSLLEIINENFIPNKVILLVNEKNKNEINRLAEYTTLHSAVNDITTVYICRNYKCSLPTSDKDKILELLN